MGSASDYRDGAFRPNPTTRMLADARVIGGARMKIIRHIGVPSIMREHTNHALPSCVRSCSKNLGGEEVKVTKSHSSAIRRLNLKMRSIYQTSTNLQYTAINSALHVTTTF